MITIYFLAMPFLGNELFIRKRSLIYRIGAMRPAMKAKHGIALT